MWPFKRKENKEQEYIYFIAFLANWAYMGKFEKYPILCKGKIVKREVTLINDNENKIKLDCESSCVYIMSEDEISESGYYRFYYNIKPSNVFSDFDKALNVYNFIRADNDFKLAFEKIKNNLK